MCTKDELINKLNERSLTPSQVFSLFEINYKPLIETPSPVNRLNGRKFGQNYGTSLVSLVRQCNTELQKKSKENSETVVNLMEMSLKLISKIHSHLFDDNNEYYQLWYAYILRLSDCGKHNKCAEISKGAILELEECSKKKDMLFLMVNIQILRCHSVLELPEKSLDKLEDIYDILAVKCKGLLSTLKTGLSQSDFQNLNRIYHSSFKILFKTGKCIDNLAGGHISLHQQALEIRQEGLSYLEKTRPFIASDYFAFAYSSVQSCYKIASSANSKALNEACVCAIDKSLEISSLHGVSLVDDKNIRSMIELQSFLYQKQDLYEAAKSSLINLISSCGDSIPTLLFNAKYSLEIAKCSYLAKSSLIRDLESAVYWMAILFEEKLTAPTSLNQVEINEIKDGSPKVQSQLENWLKIAGNLHSPSSIKQGLQLPYGTVKLLLDLLKFYPMILQFQTKLGIKTKSDWELFNYIMTLHHILAYMASRDQLFSNSSVSYMSQLLLKTDTKYLNSVYNITLGLLHTGERELAFKCILTMLEHLQISTSESNSTHLAIFELSAKYAIETNNYYTHIKKSITGYISKQIITRSVHDTRSTNLHKIIDIYCRVHMAYIDVCLLNSHPVAQLVNKEDLLGERLSPTCHAFKGEILDRELVNYYKKSLENIQTNNEKLSGYLAEIIQLIVQMLVTEVYAVNSSQYAAVVLKYIEIVSVCEKGFVGEWLISKMAELSGNLQERMLKVLESIHTPQSYVWNAILLLEQAKSSLSEDWICNKSLILYASAVKKIEKAIDLAGRTLGFKLNFEGYEWELISRSSLPDSDISEYIRALIMATEISGLLKLHKLEIQLLGLTQICIAKLPPNNDLESKLICVNLRKALSYWKEGLTEISLNLAKESSLYSPLLDEKLDIFNTELWISIFRCELSFFQGKLYESCTIADDIIKKIPSALTSNRRITFMKAYLLWIKSKIEFLNRQQTDSFNLCKEARSLINDIHANSITLQNLSLMNSVAENTKNDKFRKIIVYPYSSWSIQNLSSRLLEHISDLYQHRAQIHNSIIFLMQGVRLGLILAIPSIYLLFRSKLSNLQRISLTDSRITQENIKEEKLQNLHPVEFIARIFSMLLSPLINYSDSDSLDTVQRYDSFALSPQDVENLTGYINRSELCYSLLVLGDVLQVPDYYNQIEMPVAEQNYYKLGRSLLRPQFQGSCFKILRTLVLKKQGALVAKQRPGKDCIEMLSRAILELGCCENFIKPFFSLKLCCNNFFISPISAEELASCLLILSDALMRKGDSKTAIYISHQVESLPHFSHPTTIRHVNYLLAKERNISNWQKAYHIVKSIGVSYSMLLESQNKDLAPILSDTDLKKLFEKIPDSWSVIALSNGRGTYNDGVHLMRYFKGFDPFCTTIGGHCECTESSNLFTILENFANIMKQSANTTNSTGNIKKNSNAWWHKREKLNDHLELWLDDLQNKYLRHFATLFLGKIIDDDIHKLVLEAANEFLAAKICDNCGQMWETSYIYSLINAGISDYFTSEDIKQASLLIFSNKATDDFLKRIRSIRKISQNKEIKRGPIVLLLDGNLIHLPLESIKILRDQTVSRLPGLSFLIPRLNPYQLSLSNTFYILNPSSDLEHTQQTFEKSFLDRQNWQGIIDQAPTESEFVRALEEKDLLIYCGHSSGEQYIKGDRIKELNIRAVSLLMGCSSGLLRPCGQFEPQGVVLQYLLGGCPGIIANLWDVTDRDIDRLSLEFIKRITNLEPFGEALHKSRKACKLNYLIGAAPVYYGVPLTLNL